MTDAHCHVSCGDPAVRELLIGRDFFGLHPWDTLGTDPNTLGTDPNSNPETPGTPGTDPGSTLGTDPGSDPNLTLNDPKLTNLRQILLDHPNAGVGEIGLDRLKRRDIPPAMREAFEAQLALAVELRRSVILHGAKCWGQVVEAVSNYNFPSLLFHGFSRSDGLIPEIVKLNGFISVGPAILNDHAVNYRAMVKKIPLGRLLVETDRTSDDGQPHIRDVIAKAADILGLSFAELERITDENAERFFPSIH